jgi:hypothetical protein
MERAMDTISSGNIFTVQPQTKAMATVSNKGDVAIDWERVNEEAAGSNTMLKAFAQTLIAVRDGTYRTLP